MEEFVALVRSKGKVTVPKALRDRFEVSDGCYIHLALLEVHKKGKDGIWNKQILSTLAAKGCFLRNNIIVSKFTMLWLSRVGVVA